MYLEQIELQNFKNYASLSLHFTPGIQALVGENGSGKTNLLDAIHYLSLTKSAFNPIDQQNIRHHEGYFTIKGVFKRENSPETVFCGYEKARKKIIRHNELTYEKVSQHIGRFPVVMIAPQDQDLILEGSEARRRFFDSVIAQIDAEYLQNLLHYQYYLQQRNALLKTYYEQRQWDEDLCQTYDAGMLHFGQKIYARRQHFLQDFQPFFQSQYQQLAGQKESPQLSYHSDFGQTDIAQAFIKAREADQRLQRTTVGIHRDDFIFQLESYPLKKFGSQGQQKSYLLALKLAQFAIVRQELALKPILLLDDIFDKLDDARMQALVEMVSQQTFGQIFLTDARPERSLSVLAALNTEKQMFFIQQGKLNKTQIF
ncbi:MAG: DNA replication/repair protein RecF [Microscillaceae bacterium]|nr:DNA replication/repair protein RecF [Microscillaceae bacterium]